LGFDWNQFVCKTSQTTYLPGSRLSEYEPTTVPTVDVVEDSAMVVSPRSRTPLPFVSLYARITQLLSPTSSSLLPAMLSTPSASRLPSALTSLNLTPDFVPCWKLPKSLFGLSVPDMWKA